MSGSQDLGVSIFHARWRSSMGLVAGLMMALALGTLLLVWSAPRGAAIVMVPFALLFAWAAWGVGKPLLTRTPVVRMSRRGISGHFLKQRTIPWRDVRDLRVETVQGYSFLVLSLFPQAHDSLAKTKR